MVKICATSRLVFGKEAVFSSWPVACLKRRFISASREETSLATASFRLPPSLGTTNPVRPSWASCSATWAFASWVADLGIKPLFTSIYGSELSGKLSNKTDLLKFVIKKEGAKQALVIGDRGVDIEAAKKCACKSIGVSYGYGTKVYVTVSLPFLPV